MSRVSITTSWVVNLATFCY